MRIKVITGGLALAMIATACGGSSDAGSSGTGTKADSGDTVTIGVSQRRLAGSDWWATLIQGMKDKAKELNAEIVVTDAGGDTVKQNSDVQTLITRGVDSLIINPHDPTGVGPAVAAAKSADIPLVVVNSNLSEELAASQYCYVAENQPEVAAGMGEAVAQEAKQRFGSDKVKAVVVGGYSGETVTKLRGDGVTAGYANVPDAPEIEYLPVRYGEWLPDKALPQIRDVATANPDLDIVFSLSDVMLPGIKQGLKDAGILDKVIIGTYDGQMSVVKEMIDNPDGPVQVNASNEPYKMGQVAVEKAVAAARGEDRETVCPGGEFWIDTFLATPETAEQFYEPSRQF